MSPPGDTSESMTVTFRRTGGFAGNMPALTLDSRQLEARRLEEIARLLQSVDLAAVSDAASVTRSVGTRPDSFTYELKVVRDDGAWDLTLAESQVPPELRPLLTRLSQFATEHGG